MKVIKMLCEIFVICLMTNFAFANDIRVNINTYNDTRTFIKDSYYSYLKTNESQIVKDTRMDKFRKSISSLLNIDFVKRDTYTESEGNKISYYSNPQDSTANLEIDADQEYVLFNKRITDYDKPNNTSGLPGEYEADEISNKYLSNLSLLPSNHKAELVVEHIGGVNMAQYNKETNESMTYEKLKTVYYGRRLNGMEVLGNSRIVVSLGKDGELVGVIKKWTTVKQIRKIVKNNLRSYNQVMNHLSDLLKDLYSGNNGINEININDTKVVMYDDGRVIEPALYASGKIESLDGYSEDGDWIIPILKNPSAKYSMNEKPQITPDNADESEEKYDTDAIKDRK